MQAQNVQSTIFCVNDTGNKLQVSQDSPGIAKQGDSSDGCSELARFAYLEIKDDGGFLYMESVRSMEPKAFEVLQHQWPGQRCFHTVGRLQ